MATILKSFPSNPQIKVEDLVWIQETYELLHKRVMLSPFKSDWCKVFEDLIQTEEKVGYLSSVYNYVTFNKEKSAEIKNVFLNEMLKAMNDGNNDDLVIKIYTCNGSNKLIVTKFKDLLNMCSD